MSDEFSTPHRTFTDGHDLTWTALDKNDYTNNALHYYSSEAISTKDGHLEISTSATDTTVVGFDDVNLRNKKVVKHFKSGMIQSWDKFCFTGGIIEARVRLPGRHDTGGLWPAFWLLGNLARHTYVGTSNNVWPWSNSRTCDEGQADAQRISPCLKTGHYGMEPGVGRGAPEMDIFEVQPGDTKANQKQFLKMPVGQPFSSASLQVAPGKSWKRPGPGAWPGPGEWYDKLGIGVNTSSNINFYGTYNHFKSAASASYDYWSDAISQNRQLAEKHFEGAHVYRLEWEPPSRKWRHGYLHWYLDGDLIFAINGSSITSVTHAEIPSEPSYIILNTAVSKEWGFPMQCPAGCPCEDYDCNSPHFNARCGFSPGFCDMILEEDVKMKVDYVRVWQDPDNEAHKVGCSTGERPTRRWIEGHSEVYKMEGDERPLKDVKQGGGTCRADEDCGGGDRGECRSGGKCVCWEGKTGPNCRSDMKKDDTDWDPVDRIDDLEVYGPRIGFVFILGVAAVGRVMWIAIKHKGRLDGYSVVPDAEGV